MFKNNLNNEFHGYSDFIDDEPEYIESDLGDMIINPKYSSNNELKNAEEKLKICEEAYKNTQHEYYINEINYLKELINDLNKYKRVYDIQNSFTPAFIDFFCRKYGISHYAFNINKQCFIKYVHKNQNHRALCYYAMNNHMYLVKNKKLVKSMVGKAKDIEHNISTSILENEGVIIILIIKKVYVNKSIKTLN